MREVTKLEKARKAACMTLDAAASILGVSVPTYMKYERNPGLMTFGQYFALAAEMDEDARGIMGDVPTEVEQGTTAWKSLRDLTIGEYYASQKTGGQLGNELTSTMEGLFG